MVRPSWGSAMGWPPHSERSMILSLLWARAMGPLAHTPPPSGPRSLIVSAMRATVPTSATPPNLISPAKPHILVGLRISVEDPRVLEAAPGGGVDDARAAWGDPGEAAWHYVVDGREHERPQVHERLVFALRAAVEHVGREVQALLGHEAHRVLLHCPARAFHGFPVRLGADKDTLCPEALPRLDDQLGEMLQRLGELPRIPQRQGVYALKNRFLA